MRQRRLSASVRLPGGRPSLFVNEREVLPMFYALTNFPGGRWTWEEMPRRNLSLFAGLGFALFQADIMLEHLWGGEGLVDTSLLESQMRGILDACPEAGIVIRLHVNAPRWWNLAHPQECVLYADGPVDAPPARGIERPLDRDLERGLHESFASLVWREEAGAVVRKVCRRLSHAPEGDALIGIHVADGVFGEWASFGFIRHDPDTGPAMTSAFRRWLALRYRTDEALRAAWNDAAASLATVEVPGVEERTFTAQGVFRDPERQRRVMDYFACQHETVADAIIHFCRIVKESWPRPLITGTFYGYVFSQFGRQAAGGHLAVERILASPHVDYLSAPQTYQPYSRDMGGTGQARGLVESCALHGKLWLDEMDQPTHLGCMADRSYACTLPDAVALLRRNVAHPLLRGGGLWYYDFGPRFSSGWWDDPVLADEIRRLRILFERRKAAPHDSPADVLFVCDMGVFCHTGHSAADPVSEPALDRCASALYRSGACFAMAWLCDLPLVDLERYRTIVFANTWVLTPAQKEHIGTRVAAGGRHLLWVYAPGYSDGSRLSTSFLSEVTGMRMERVDHRLPAVLRSPDLLEAEGPIAPLFRADDGGAETIAQWAGTAMASVSRKEGSGHTSWFCALPPVGPGLLRRILRESGAHLYDDHGDVLFGGRGMICVHSREGGARTLVLRSGRNASVQLPPRSTTFIDAVDGRVLE